MGEGRELTHSLSAWAAGEGGSEEIGNMIQSYIKEIEDLRSGHTRTHAFVFNVHWKVNVLNAKIKVACTFLFFLSSL